MGRKWIKVTYDGIHIENSYNVWSPGRMRQALNIATSNPKQEYNRSYFGMMFEWYLHNIGYYCLFPFKWIPAIAKLQKRLQHVDLERYD